MENRPTEDCGDRRPAAGPAGFPTTHWSMIRRAGAGAESEAEAALAKLCGDYWYPLYAYVRRSGASAHDAQDLTQSFILELIEGPLLSRADPGKGRFRSFMLGALQNFLSHEHRRRQTKKRGGKEIILSLDEAAAEHRFAAEPKDDRTPEDHYDRNWAFALIETVLSRLRAEYEGAGRRELFEVLQPYLAGKAGQAAYAVAGQRLALSENTVAVSVHRMRRRYGELLREEIALTVSSPQEVEEELNHLRAILARC